MQKCYQAIVICLLPFVLLAEENPALSFVFPVDWSVEPRVNLSVDIPPDFKAVQPASSWNQAELIEFIPQQDDVSNWSEIITIQKLINRRISADQLSALLIENLSKTVKLTVLLNERANQGYEEDRFIVQYDYNGRDEVLGAKYVSGPYDSVGVQYTIRLHEGISQKQAVDKIKSFLDNNLTLLKTPANADG